jgi:hypothetical protein
MSYIPKPGDKVKIVGLHNDDAYSKHPDNYIGLVVVIDIDELISETAEGYFTFRTADGYCFYAAKVEPVSN